MEKEIESLGVNLEELKGGVFKDKSKLKEELKQKYLNGKSVGRSIRGG